MNQHTPTPPSDPRIDTLARTIATELRAEGWTELGGRDLTDAEIDRLGDALGLGTTAHWSDVAPQRRELLVWIGQHLRADVVAEHETSVARQTEIAAALYAADPYEAPAEVDGYRDLAALAAEGRAVRFTEAEHRHLDSLE